MKVDPKILLNIAAVQLGWFACVLGGANGLALTGTLTVMVVVGMHLALARRPGPEALLIAVAATIGLAWDSMLVALGLMSYPSGSFAPGLAPHWIVAMWALFATSLNLSMSWLKGRPRLAALFGAVGGPLAYLSGARLGPHPAAAGPAGGAPERLRDDAGASPCARLPGVEPCLTWGCGSRRSRHSPSSPWPAGC